MADLSEGEITGVVEGEPDLSDLSMVVVNVETADGRQLSMVFGIDDPSDRLSLHTGEDVGADGSGYEEWNFKIKRTSVA